MVTKQRGCMTMSIGNNIERRLHEEQPNEEGVTMTLWKWED